MTALPPTCPARALLFVALVTTASPLPAQRPQTVADAVLRVRVAERTTGEPIMGARVAILDTPLAAETGPDGLALLAGIAPGPRLVEVGSTGFGGAHVVLEFTAGDTLDVELRLAPQRPAPADVPDPTRAAAAAQSEPVANEEPIPLERIEATAERWVRALDQVGFYHRRRMGHGIHLTREDLDRDAQFQLSDALRRINSIRVMQYRGRDVIRLERGSIGCDMRIYLDGVLLGEPNLRDIPAEDVEAMEVYRSASDVPQQFRFGTEGCGAIVVWTRKGDGR